jgi:hypothetical protein
MKYRKKPVVIEAAQLKNNVESIKEVCELMGITEEYPQNLMIKNARINKGIYVASLVREGETKLSFDDFLIKGVEGEFYTCKPDIFKLTYEEVKSNGNN